MVQASNPRFPLSLYKLRDGITEPAGFVDVSGFPFSADISIGEGVATLHYGMSMGTPRWLQSLAAAAVTPLQELQASAVSGVLLAHVNQRHFALTFGHAWQRVKHTGIEPNFGIRCVLNLAKADSLRAIRRDRVADTFIQPAGVQ